MYKFGKNSVSGFIMLFLFLLGIPTLQMAVDQKDPEALANYVLQAIRVNDLDALYNVMDKDKKMAYTPFTPSKRDGLLELVEKDQKKIGKRTKIAELRKCTTISGKQGVAAKVKKKGKEVFVIILAIDKNDNLYYYEETLTLSSKLYKELKAFK
jgi:hypothetical protein